MGVPDFVKFIARSSPGALCRLPKGGSTSPPLLFDFILIDATNSAQTLGLETLRNFLHPQRLAATSAVIFALDSQRDRSGTARAHRREQVRIGDLDVLIQKLCEQLSDAYRVQQNAYLRHEGGGTSANPFILSSGRDVAGEADYKLLDLQRSIVASAIAAGATTLPTFLFITEDSDILCGALCGPAPQQVSIATKLQDVLFEPSILRLNRVLAYVATCTDAFYVEKEKMMAELAAVKAKAAAERNLLKQQQRASTVAVEAGSEVAHAAASKADVDDQVELSVKDTAVTPVAVDDVVRRRKLDGPMVATGVRIELTDSSDDDESGTMEALPPATFSSAPSRATSAASAGAVKKASKEGDTLLSSDAADASNRTVTDDALLISTITRGSCVDMVFLFMMVMGNAVNVPSLIRGATKVDITSCWQAYCKHKYKNLSATETETGRSLITVSAKAPHRHEGSLVLHCNLLYSILETVHYADAEPRPPVEEEKHRAMSYLSNAVYAILRYIIGCNLEKTPTLQYTFLDSRPLSETTITPPSLSAVMWVLSQEPTLTFSFPLYGLAKRELVAAASGGSSATTGNGEASASPAPRRGPAQRGTSASFGELDVAEHLVTPVASNAWAVRGARSRHVSVGALLQKLTKNSQGSPVPAGGGSHPSAATLRSAPLPSVTALVQQCLQRISCASLTNTNILQSLISLFTYTLAVGVRSMAALTQAVASTSRAEGGDTVLGVTPAASPACYTGDGDAIAEATPTTSGARFVYSFELRRMAPVLQTVTAPPSSAFPGACAPPTANASRDAVHPAEGTSSAARQAILAALGVSFDYSSAPRPTANVVKLPRSAMDDDDKEEMQRLKKVARKERAAAAAVLKTRSAKLKGSGEEREVTLRSADTETAVSSRHRLGVANKDTIKTKKRLGKRERLKRHKVIEKAVTGVFKGSNAAAETS